MKKLRLFCWVLAIALLCCSFVGCGSWARLREEEIYKENLDAFFDALDAGDSDALYALFSPTAQKHDADLACEIDRLIALYPRAETELHFHGIGGGEYHSGSDGFESTVYATVPVVNSGRHYWVYLELTYEDDLRPEDIGISRVQLYTVDEYCLYYHDEGAKFPTELGLLVYAEREIELEVRCIDNHPYAFTPIDRELDLAAMEAFLQNDTTIEAFAQRFGQPNAGVPSSLYTAYYELPSTDGTHTYLALGVVDGVIEWANIEGEYAWIRSVKEAKAD